MKRVALAIAVVLGVGVLAYLRCGTTSTKTAPTTSSPSGSAVRTARSDPRTLAKGSLAGTIRDPKGAPIAGAMACADFWSPALSEQTTRDALCVIADARGAYRFDNLVAATYSIDAMAKGFEPGTYQKGDEANIELAPGMALTGLDITLGSGAVEVTGTVSDASGGAIRGARVRVISRMKHPRSQAFAETDAAGKYALWTAPGYVEVYAVADGYVESEERGMAPGSVDLSLVPESSIAGTVLDADTREPVAGVRVEVYPMDFMARTPRATTLSDERGRFRISRLLPARYQPRVKHGGYYTVSAPTALVGLAESVEDVVLLVKRGYMISGKALVTGTNAVCKPSSITLGRDQVGYEYEAESADDGTITVDSVRPGTWIVRLFCSRHQPTEDIAPVTITNADVTGLVWHVAPGSTLTGTITTRAGAPVADARITARASSPVQRGAKTLLYASAKPDGRYELGGLVPGTWDVEVSSGNGVAPPKVSVEITDATATQDFVLDEGGTLRGVVVDPKGAPVPHVDVTIARQRQRIHVSFTETEMQTGSDGSFVFTGLVPGTYDITAKYPRGGAVRRADNANEQLEDAVVENAKTTEVRIAIEDATAVIRGSVVDGKGTPIGDAFVNAIRQEPDQDMGQALRWTFDEKLRLTAPDGTFAITGLAAGTYSVRAYRRGGGDAIVENVKTGTSVKVQILDGASIEGTVTGAAGDELSVSANGGGIQRTETFYKSGGVFAIRDLPAGVYTLSATSGNASGGATATVAAGETKRGVTIALAPQATVTGTLVDYATKKPIPSAVMFGTRLASTTFTLALGTSESENTTDARGRFTIRDVPTGDVVIVALLTTERDLQLYAPRTLPSKATIELGEVPVMMPRVRQGAGKLGYTLVSPIDQWFTNHLAVATVDAAATKAGLRTGDVITSVDGIDVRGEHAGYYESLVRVAPGTKLALGLARGATVELVAK
jgi:protocatechuate 3,4-dioxygenase beta subunit